MNADEIVKSINQIVQKKTGKNLTRNQVNMLCLSLENLSYYQMSRLGNKSETAIKKEGTALWKLLTNVLGEKVTKPHLGEILEKIIYQESNTVSSIVTNHVTSLSNSTVNNTDDLEDHDWADAPDVSTFFGREAELNTLRQWILQDHCRLVAILGMAGVGKTFMSARLGQGGIGKTDLSVKLAEGIADDFQYIIWRSLLNAPTVNEILTDWLQKLSRQTISDLPKQLDQQILLLLKFLKKYRCLLILDNAESILMAGDYAGKYKPEFTDYGQLFQKIGQVPHNSCLLITSREKLIKLQPLVGKNKPVRFLELSGLELSAGQQIFQEIGDFSADQEQWQELIEFYQGNPLALELTAHHIHEDFAGDIGQFWLMGRPVFQDLRELLDWHWQRLSPEEQEILYWLAIYRQPVNIENLQQDIVSPHSQQTVSENVRSLQSKLPLEKTEGGKKFTLQPMLIEYMTEKIIHLATTELITGQLSFLHSHALMLADGQDYVRESQVKTIVQPIAQKLIKHFINQHNLANHCQNILDQLRIQKNLKPGYAGGNIINLLCHLQIDLTNYDFSHLSLWQAYLQDINLYNVDFSYSDLTRAAFTKSFRAIQSLAFSPDGELLAVGDFHGQIRILQVKDWQEIRCFHAHQWFVSTLAFHPNGKKLVSGGLDRQAKLWDIETGEYITLLGHTQWVWSVAYRPDGEIIATACDDKNIRFLDGETGELLNTLSGHTDKVLAIAFAPDGKILASSGSDRTIKLWDVATGKCLQTITGHKDAIWCLAFSPDGKFIASSGFERLIRLWNRQTNQWEKVLTGHTKELKTLAFTPDSQTLISACFQPTVRFWNVNTGKCRAIGLGHFSGIYYLAISPHGQTVATGDSHFLKIWSVATGKCLKTLVGYTNWVAALTINPDNTIIASAHLDFSVQLWDLQTGKQLNVLKGHRSGLRAVTFSPDGQTVASAGDDETIKIWDIQTGKCLKTFHYVTEQNDYQGGIWAIAFSPDGRWLASGGQDQTVKIWDVEKGEVWKNLIGHQDFVWTLAFHPDVYQTILASGSDDGTIKIWDVNQGKCLTTLIGHQNKVKAIAFNSDGQLLFSGCEDGTSKLWQIEQAECLQTMAGHAGGVWAVAISHNDQLLFTGSQDHTIKIWDIGCDQYRKILTEHSDTVTSLAITKNDQTLISGSFDGTIRLWRSPDYQCQKTIQVTRPYEGMNIVRFV